ncbi:gamma-glutamyl-gamma-aminobutyrate hydrolase family protein [Paenibacillus sediminis]|uniref:Glutamine amidotransferase n=1 Tax=Paenibacillus sediminis TaxID=664909 RepID=A0ABS4H3U2_9BACL|nr:gamma-glutamyl-gamma-aminobutyrate hydrolase family protein [Paenibacillus sediminis]MBP1937032.1 putative glutamine amidotransferase [Paenibacillus sediminis]
MSTFQSTTYKPLIGITSTLVSIRPGTAGSYVADGYFEGLARYGAIPVVIPLMSDEEVVKELIERVDGVLFSGGEDIGPHLYGEMPHPKLGEVMPKRDRLEMAAIRHALSLGKPVLGICRGVQVLNVAMGGTLVQDLPSQEPGSGQHMQKAPRPEPTHYVDIQPNTQLHEIFQKERVFTNSFHHQAVKSVAPGFTASAFAQDGVIEAIESRDYRFAVGVQWHPENMWLEDADMAKLCEAFIKAARQK